MNLQKLENIPDKPGVYLFKDKEEKIIYIGKALSLKKRVRSYFRTAQTLSPRLGALTSRIKNLDYIVTDSEVEALILEGNLIKVHQPRYNARLKDDKKYPFVKLTNEEYPRLFITRKIEKDGSKYYGPYTDVKMLRKTLKFLGKLFPLRSCRKVISRAAQKKQRPCLNYDLKLCFAPCAGKVGREAYLELVREACLFLEGKGKRLVKELTRLMHDKSRALCFEEARLLRDRIRALEKITQKQKITLPGGGDEDYLAFAREGDGAVVNVFRVREGRAIGQDSFSLKAVRDLKEEEILESFLKQYYLQVFVFPREIFLPCPLEEAKLAGRFLEKRSGRKIKLSFPQRGRRKKLLQMIARNARLKLEEKALPAKKSKGKQNKALTEIKKVLHLTALPYRIEAFDISHFAGQEAVGSLVVFEGGTPRTGQYRRFCIKIASSMDDYAMLREIILRRYQRILEEKQGLPDLALIDGGKGQLSSALTVLKQLGLEEVSVAAIAKRSEEVFIKGNSQPVNFSSGSSGHLLIREIRDEAHRFALTFHRSRRGKKFIKS